MKTWIVLFSVGAVGLSARAQTTPAVSPVSTTVVVVGSPEPVTIGETNRSATVLNTEKHPLAYQQTEDYLRTDASVFVEQRGAGGSQADISIRGTSFEQTLVLLNGLRINDAETSHNNMDIPVPLAALRSIDVLQGAGSTLYGSDAIGGVVDFVTAKPKHDSLLLRAGGGNYGENEQEAVAAAVGRKWSELLAGERDFSSGFMYDRDYRDEEASSESRYDSRLGESDILVAGDDRAFGANNFYGNYPSYERTKGWFASMQQALGEHTDAAFGYRRHTDEYVLFRNDPAIYENNHIDTSWQAALRRQDAAGRDTRLFYGLEADGDGIHSNNLGVHARNWGAGYLDAEVQAGRASLTAGLRQEMISGGYFITSPMLAAGYFVTRKIKLRGNAGYGFRLPTYLDLYYSDPGTIGNPHLKPESAWNFEGGADWFANARLYVASTVFYSRQHDAIDYTRATASDPYQATNLTGLSFVGWENSAVWEPDDANEMKASWTLLSGAQKALHGLQSEYVFNYPVNNASLEGTHTWAAGYMVHTRIGVTERYEKSPYAVWDLAGARDAGRWRPYVQLTNITNTGYQEVYGVQMPGRAVVAGLEISLIRGARRAEKP
jgi:iron complex outermembrane receptor protein